ncbi:hypothetical protein COMA1_50049 [Candidatus Nitrospira nitrosa]|uniref:Uncharacterized protein n=1 Tax=Candidatus Nitrospira nitrosa TaxID=1742972 RepID=A0A0S4LLC5_9BACT|nr:hypothetical protein COMA1_50049 [Candidatus Nitrospira nitrosa]
MYPARSVSLLAFHVNVADELDGALSVSVIVTVLMMLPLATVIVAWFSPCVAFEVSTLAVMVPLADPEV